MDMATKPDVNDDFDDAFASFAADKAADHPGQDGDQLEGDGQQASEEGGSDAAATPPADEAAGDQTQAPPAQAAPQVDEIFANATPEQQAAYQAAIRRATELEHADRSNRGRLSTFQRQLNEARAAGFDPTKAAPPRGAAAIRAMIDSDEVRAASSDYADIADPILNIVRAQQEVLEAAEARQQEQDQERTAAYLIEQEKVVSLAHPDYATVARSQGFTDWYRTQPDGVKEMIERNAAQIVNGAEVASVVRLFKAETGFGQPSADNTATNRNDAIRQRQLAGSRTIQNKGGSTTTAVPDNFDGAWEAFAARKRM